MHRPVQEIRYEKFLEAEFDKTLHLEPPLFVGREAWGQLFSVARHAARLGCKSIAIESHYIDRHYMEEHGVFYSRNLVVYRNYCQRVHFFTSEPGSLESELKSLRLELRDESTDGYRSRCQEFSERAYLGFCVVKPLPGCPVGRTVLKPYDPKPPSSGAYKSSFSCTRPYIVHFAGLELKVIGLAFQQQDLGVSACATTALWSALQKVNESEEINSTTPAQITLLASQYALPFGRPLPSEGLSLGQMCQAVRSLSLAPVVIPATAFDAARGYLYSTVLSNAAAVLILDTGDDKMAHAVTLVGAWSREPLQPCVLQLGLDDQAGNLQGIYVHDDRNGPYMPAAIRPETDRLWLDLDLNGRIEPWRLSHLLIPFHAKIRCSFTSLRRRARQTVGFLTAYQRAANIAPDSVSFVTWIRRSHRYVKELLTKATMRPEAIEQLIASVALPRYVGVIRLESDSFGPVDVLVDTTSTDKNFHISAVVVTDSSRELTVVLAELLAAECSCPLVA